MTPGVFQLLSKHAAKVAPSQKHQEILDSTFSTHDDQRWRDFRRAARSAGFVNAVKSDERADPKMKRYAEALHMHYRGKGPMFPVPGSGTKTHTVKHHEKEGRWSCSCPDWGYVRSHQTDKAGQDCKHIQMVKHEIQSRAEAGIDKQAGVLHAALPGGTLIRNAGLAHKREQQEGKAFKSNVTNQLYQATKHASVLRGAAAGIILEEQKKN